MSGANLTRLPINAREGFVLSRIDGRASLVEIASMTGFAVNDVADIVAKLVELRAVQFGSGPPPQPSPTPPIVEAASSAKIATGAVAKAEASTELNTGPMRALLVPPKARPRKWSPSDLDEPAELDVALKTQILDLFTSLDDLDHYELLHVARDADRKTIKSAYYALAARLHTDRHFGKKLGSFKTKMEQIFGRITIAHDTLAAKQRRAEYDAYLVERDRTRAFERYLAGEDAFEEVSADPLPPPTPVSEPKVTTVPPVEGPSPTASMPVETASALDESQSQSQSKIPSAHPRSAEDERQRREALAKRLTGSQRFRTVPGFTVPPTSTARTPVPTVAPTAEQARAATESIKRRYEEGVENARKGQARRLVQAAEEALARKDVVTAANSYRLALKYSDDPELKATFESINRQARDVMAEAYLKQAKYEEQATKWPEAAASYAKAAEGRPDDPSLSERAAHCLRMEGRDLHRAARFAETAMQKNPTSAPFRVTLARVYLDAGLILRARSELEQAAKLEPNDAQIKDLLAQAKRMAS